MLKKTAEELHGLVRGILLAAGADERNAERVAEGLVLSDLSGVETHGVHHLPGYVADIRAGYIVPTAWPETISETPTSALITGNWTFGFSAAKYAMEAAIRKAKEHNVAVVGIVQAGHIGRLGEYAEMAAAEGMISFTWAGGYSEDQQTTVPHGGRKRVLHTNPLSMGFPAGEEPPLVLDFATTATSGSKVVLARKRKQQVPPGCIIDKDGNPTTDPEDFFTGGAHLPFGGHKGYAIMLAVEYLGRILTGSDSYAEAHRGGIYQRHQGVSMMALKADVFQPMKDLIRRSDELERRMRSVPPAPGFKEVLVPGDMEQRAREVRRREGIPVADDTWRELTELAASLGVEVQ
jgi:LDH2 family malate/lactate/ureidoglycolate dehydrogenase